jgi:O-antigen ligase
LSTLMKIDSPGMRSADSSIRERSTIYLSGIRIFLDHPLLGVGIGQAPEYLPEYSNYSGHSRLHRKMGPHNMYLESLAETGVLGFAALMAMITLVIRRMWRLRQYWKIRNPEYAHTATSLLLAIAVFLVTGLFLHLAYARYFWLLFAMAGAAHAVYSPLPEASPASAEEPRSANTVPTRPRYVPVAQRLFTE